EQESSDGRRGTVDVHVGGDPFRGAKSERVEPPEPVLNVEVRVGLGGDPQGAFGQRTRLGPSRQRDEPASRIHDVREPSESRTPAPAGVVAAAGDQRETVARGGPSAVRSPRGRPSAWPGGPAGSQGAAPRPPLGAASR